MLLMEVRYLQRLRHPRLVPLPQRPIMRAQSPTQDCVAGGAELSTYSDMVSSFGVFRVHGTFGSLPKSRSCAFMEARHSVVEPRLVELSFRI